MKTIKRYCLEILCVALILAIHSGLCDELVTGDNTVEDTPMPVDYTVDNAEVDLPETINSIEKTDSWRKLGEDDDGYKCFILPYETGCKYIYTNPNGSFLLKGNCISCTKSIEGFCAVYDGDVVTVWNLHESSCVERLPNYALYEFQWISELPFILRNKQNGRFGIFEPRAKKTVVFDGTVSDIFAYSSGYAAFKSKDGKWGYLDINGKTIIDPIYKGASSFNQAGLAATMLDDDTWIIIRNDGSVVSTHPYDVVLEIDDSSIICENKGADTLTRVDIYGEHELDFDSYQDDFDE